MVFSTVGLVLSSGNSSYIMQIYFIFTQLSDSFWHTTLAIFHSFKQKVGKTFMNLQWVMLHQPMRPMFVYLKKTKVFFLEKKYGRPWQTPLVSWSIQSKYKSIINILLLIWFFSFAMASCLGLCGAYLLWLWGHRSLSSFSSPLYNVHSYLIIK